MLSGKETPNFLCNSIVVNIKYTLEENKFSLVKQTRKIATLPCAVLAPSAALVGPFRPNQKFLNFFLLFIFLLLLNFLKNLLWFW